MEGQRLDPRQVGRNVVMTAAIAGLGGLLLLIEALGRGGAFLFYAAICVVTFFFCRRLVPETKGKHLEDITAVFEQAGRQALEATGRRAADRQARAGDDLIA